MRLLPAMWLAACTAQSHDAAPFVPRVAPDDVLASGSIDLPDDVVPLPPEIPVEEVGLSIGTAWIDLGAIERLSRFRSTVGHDYSDAFEDCSSMKHYFVPRGGDPGRPHSPSWTTIPITVPVDGEIRRVQDEWGDGSGGFQVWIATDADPAVHVVLFHVGLATSLQEGDSVAEGDALGFHATDETWHDVTIAAFVDDPDHPGGDGVIELHSPFELMNDALFSTFEDRGVVDHTDVIISAEERADHPVACTEHRSFVGADPLEGWTWLSTP